MVAAKCTRVMYIVDGNIKGEHNLGKYKIDSQKRERALNAPPLQYDKNSTIFSLSPYYFPPLSIRSQLSTALYPFSTSDEYFADPYKEYRITICGQTIILTNGNLAAALLSFPYYFPPLSIRSQLSTARQFVPHSGIACYAHFHNA